MSRIEGLRNEIFFDDIGPTIGTQVVKQPLNNQLTHREKTETNAQSRLTTEDHHRLDTAVETINKTLDVFGRGLEFSIHEDTNRIIVKVIDRSNFEDEVIREIPPEKILDMMAEVLNIIGLLIDQRA